MKIKKYDDRINVKIDSKFKEDIEKKLAAHGYDMSAFIREKLEEFDSEPYWKYSHRKD